LEPVRIILFLLGAHLGQEHLKKLLQVVSEDLRSEVKATKNN